MSVVFVGSQPIGHDCLEEIINLGINVKAVFTMKPEKHEKWDRSVDSVAEKNNISLFYNNELKSEKIREYQPDLIIVVGYRRIFEEEILEIPKLGVIGLHASLLPKYRGFAPLNWAIINDDKETGVTLFVMEKGIDTGNILAQKKVEIKVNDTISILKNKIIKLSIELIRENLQDILNGEKSSEKQDEKECSYCGMRIPEDSRIFWNKNSKEIHNIIRSSESNYPAFTYFNSKKLFIRSSELISTKFFGTPGQVLKILDDGVYIATNDGCIKILEMNWEDEKIVSANQILSSLKFRLS